MIQEKHKIYYYYNVPSRSDPSRSRLSDEDVRYHLGRFPDELSGILWDIEDKPPEVNVVEEHYKDQYIVVDIRSPMDKDEFYACMKTALNGLDLFAERIPTAKK